MKDAYAFVDDRRRKGLGYTWGSTPPKIITSGGVKIVK
jgi:hypothetical protein